MRGNSTSIAVTPARTGRWNSKNTVGLLPLTAGPEGLEELITRRTREDPKLRESQLLPRPSQI
jgi:hypothetical protein